MREAGHVDHTTYGGAIQAVAQSRPDKAYEYMEQMLDAGLMPSRFAAYIVIRTAFMHKDSEAGWKMFMLVRSQPWCGPHFCWR